MRRKWIRVELPLNNAENVGCMIGTHVATEINKYADEMIQTDILFEMLNLTQSFVVLN